MSDLYLVLRSRLEAVTDWVTLGSAVMKAARQRKGYSYETIARLLPVSSKTYERYEKKGQVPRALLVKIADALDLEIEQPARERVSVAAADRSPLEGLEAVVDRFERIADRMEESLGDAQDDQQ